MQDAHFAYKRLISNARIQKSLKGQIKYEVEEYWRPNFLKVWPNTAKVIYSWGRKAKVFQKFKSCVNSSYTRFSVASKCHTIYTSRPSVAKPIALNVNLSLTWTWMLYLPLDVSQKKTVSFSKSYFLWKKYFKVWEGSKCLLFCHQFCQPFLISIPKERYCCKFLSFIIDIFL